MIKINQEKCNGCGECVEICAQEAIEIKDEKAQLDTEMCIDCWACVNLCPEEAIEGEEEIGLPQASAPPSDFRVSENYQYKNQGKMGIARRLLSGLIDIIEQRRPLREGLSEALPFSSKGKGGGKKSRMMRRGWR